MENTIQLELLELIKNVQKFQKDYLPAGAHIGINICDDDQASVHCFTYSEHATGLGVMRLLGISDADKQVHDPNAPWHCLIGNITPKVDAKIYCSGLPPSCRVETYEEEIPKTDIVTLAETVKVKRTRICCGEGK